jgi:acetyl esterase/lipase
MLDRLAPDVKRGHEDDMKWVGIIIGALALIGATIGYASSWSMLGLMNRLDGVLADGNARLAERGTPYGMEARQKLNIWVPAKGAKAAPVLVFFYGGSWKMGERDFYDFFGRALAAQGFVVVLPDYRLTPQVRFPAFVQDAAAAVAWTQRNIAKYGGDPTRISVSGHSAGAHLAAMLTLDRQWLAQAGAPANTIRSFVGLAGPYDFLPFTSDASKVAFGHEPDPRITQPITFARSDAAPMLLLTGTADDTVKPRNSRVLAAAQTKLGALGLSKDYADIDHSEIIQSFARPFRDKSSALADLVKFVNDHSHALDKTTTRP